MLRKLLSAGLFRPFTFLLLVLSTLALSACGGDSGTSTTLPSGTSPSVSLKAVDNYGAYYGEPRYVVDASNGRLQYWTDYSGNITQGTYTSTSGDVHVRFIYDTSTGEPRKIINELTGDYIVINDDLPNRVDFLAYSSSDLFQEGFAIYEDNGRFYTAQVVAAPSFSGQLTGSVTDSSGADVGTFALVQPDNTIGLIGIQEVDPAFYDIVNGLLAFDSSNTLSYKFSLPSLSRVLKVGGTILAGGALAGVAAPAMGAAGVGMILAGYGANDIAGFIQNKFQSDNPTVQEIVDIAVSALGDPTDSISNLYSNLQQELADASQYTSAAVDALTTSMTTAYDTSGYTNLDSELYSYQESQPADAPPSTSTAVIGQAAEQTGDVYSVSGSVAADGTVTVNGSTDTGSATLSMNGSLSAGTVSGSYTSTNYPTGAITGTAEAIGSCQTTQNSGGQGTFSYVHNVGSGSGTVDFTYDAYSIPDAFTVRTASGEKFSTGGLVSYGTTVQLSLSDEPLVFVSVTAPNSGTAWEYAISCTY